MAVGPPFSRTSECVEDTRATSAMGRGAISMAKVNDAVASASSVAVYVTLTALSVGASGVPASVRVDGSNDSPAGSLETP